MYENNDINIVEINAKYCQKYGTIHVNKSLSEFRRISKRSVIWLHNCKTHSTSKMVLFSEYYNDIKACHDSQLIALNDHKCVID